jgi:uroporphyrinogen decarboxylase
MSTSQFECLWPGRKPDFSRLETVFRRGTPEILPFIELFADPEVISAVLGEPFIPYNVPERSQRNAGLLQRIRFCYRLGWDYVWFFIQNDFEHKQISTEDTAQLPRSQRNWVDESSGLIQTWEDFERYAWPEWGGTDAADFELMARSLPDGMKIMVSSSGVLEYVMWVMGFTPFSFALYEQPDLVQAMFTRVGDILARAMQEALRLPGVGAFFLGDDMGYKTGTFIKPAQMRQYLFPQQKRLAQIAHARGLPFLLHSCGNLERVMEDLIEEVGIDGKHSFEDVIQPVADFKRQYGSRISVLGGVDVDFLCRSTEDEVRAYTRRVLEECIPGGGYALGTGNSLANYIPLGNYLAMLEEGVRLG